ncbi:MAG: FAD-dependent oxidoreductase [Armatimonadota bacterium]
MITRDITTDVLVVGAGVSGIPAAIGAVRAGARVVLLEEDLLPGGAPVDNYITMPCGTPHTGIYREMLARLDAAYAIPVKPHGPHLAGWDRFFLPSSCAVVVAEMLRAEPLLEMHCGVRVTKPLVEDRQGQSRVVGVLAPGVDGQEYRIRAGVTIDATGTGLLAAQAGCAVMYGRDSRTTFHEPHAPDTADNTVQPCTWMYLCQRLGSGDYFDMRQLAYRGMVDPAFGWIGADEEKASTYNSGIYLAWGATLDCADTRDEQALAVTQVDALARLQDDLALLHRNGFMTYLAPKMGIRECRRIAGEHVISEHDVRTGRMPDDVVAVGQWWLDIWGQHLPKEEREVPPIGIPYRALLPVGVDGLLVAGKAISGTHIAMSAYRVQPIMASVGQAAGVAAALAAREQTEPRSLAAELIRRELAAPAQGVTLDPAACSAEK